ncbi:alpha-tocopherol transfer protein-like [Harmonia axyridis]|uniref:alpha-tocopherol transfer protein-like n=1 Tax=Harmonia axyridis TaxID=115357 RepID=UPI001E2772CC|nr:alpha-tocopherol transfer protein-like [Harmonia axyridis]
MKEEDVKILREWITKQPHLPQNIHDTMLLRFLHTCNYSIEQTKTLIELFYTIRSQAPELFSNRDPTQSALQDCFKAIDMVPLPKLTGKNYKLLLYRFVDTDPEKFMYADSVKSFYMVSDVRMLVEKEFPEGEVPIFDMAGMSWKHMTKMPLPIVKKYMVYSQEAHPIKLKEIHLVNAPNFLDRAMAMMRPFIKSEILSMIHTHPPNSTTLFDYVPKELLPEEYGGSIGKMKDLKEMWLKRVMEHKEYLTDESRWSVNESKRSAHNESKKPSFGMEGSFRTLSID